MNFPKRWQDCDPFLDALVRRQYLNQDTKDFSVLRQNMSDGAYLYLYELWQDGVRHGRLTAKA